MQERRRLVEMWNAEMWNAETRNAETRNAGAGQGGAVALATLVRVEGSSYRRTGARMLIAADGRYAGAISGGCLEAEVLRKAAWKVRHGATVERFSTLFDDTAEIPFGLGCGGTVDLLLEPAATPECAALMQALEASLRGEQRHVVTHLPQTGNQTRSPLCRTITDAAGRVLFSSGPPPAVRHPERNGAAVEPKDPEIVCAVDDLQQLSGNPASAVFTETLTGPQRLLLFGAGDDAQPVVRLAALLGWDVTVIDGRAQWARPERFPGAARVLTAQSLDGNDLAGLAVTPQDAAVVMTHSYEQDRAWLAALLPRAPRYLGLLGARHRSALLVAEAAALLHLDLDRVCDAIFAPVGLDLGGDGAEAIALAMVAEIQACVEGRLAASRRLTPQVVNDLIAAGGVSRYLQAQCAL